MQYEVWKLVVASVKMQLSGAWVFTEHSFFMILEETVDLAKLLSNNECFFLKIVFELLNRSHIGKLYIIIQIFYKGGKYELC